MSPTPTEDLPVRVAALHEQLERRAGSLAQADPVAAEAAVAELFEFLGGCDDAEAVDELDRAGALAALRSRFGPAVLGFMAAAELASHERLVGAARRGELDRELRANPWGAYAPLADLLGELEPELGLVERAAVIGAGPLPDSLLCLRDLYPSALLTGFDSDREAIAHGGRLLDQLGIDGIELRQAPGAEIDYAGFDLLCLSVFATPRAAILERIGATADPGARLILREPRGAATLVFEPGPERLPSRLTALAEPGRPGGRLMLRRRLLAVGERPH